MQGRAKVQEARARVVLWVALSQVQVPLLQEEQVQVQDTAHSQV